MKTVRQKIHIDSKTNIIDAAKKAANKLGLSYNFEAIKFILDTENISIGQLRCAQFFNGKEYYIDIARAAYFLVVAGLIGSKQESKTDIEKLEEHANKILDTWQKRFDVGLLYLTLVCQLEERHFFVSGTTLSALTEMDSVNLLSSVKDCMHSMLVQEITEKSQLTNIRDSLIMLMNR